MLASIMALLPIIKMVLEIFHKTDTEKLGDVSQAISRALSEVKDGLAELKENPGDTTSLEDAINRARRRAK